MKVVWLCHFANQEMKDYFNTPHINEFAPWIDLLIKLFINQKEIELHIIAPNVFTNKDHYIKIKNVHYHFYKYMPFPENIKIFKQAHSFFKLEFITHYVFVRTKISRLLKSIKPDIIHLHGAENPYYSAGLLNSAKKYPNIVSIQGFIRNSRDNSFSVQERIKLEENILSKTGHIGVRTREMADIARTINPIARLHYHNYPVKVPSLVKNNIGEDETIDCIFFARVSKDKGIEDLLEAISIIKKNRPSISLTVIGGTDARYMQYLKNLSLKLQIDNNVDFIGFVPTQEDIYKYAIKAKICVLPTYHDIIPGTIIESMFLKLPVIAYAVGGIPELNEKGNAVALITKQQTTQLAKKIISLLNNVEERKAMAKTAYNYAKERFDCDSIIVDIMKAYRIILQSTTNTK